MDLWIRTQTEGLHKITGIDKPISTIDHDYRLIGYSDNRSIGLGKYESKERALEVLNEIQNRLINLQCLDVIKDITPSMKRQGVDCVFVMPQE